jgi:hypothetical protein
MACVKEYARLNGVRQYHNQKTMQLQKRIKTQCDPSIRPSKRVVCSQTESSKDDVKTISFRKTRSRLILPRTYSVRWYRYIYVLLRVGLLVLVMGLKNVNID